MWAKGVPAIICISGLKIVRSRVLYYVCCINYMYCIYLSYTYTMCNTIQEYGFYSYNYRFINLFNMLLYFTVILNQVKHFIIYLFSSTK